MAKEIHIQNQILLIELLVTSHFINRELCALLLLT